mgnify:CR=1 FL=1
MNSSISSSDPHRRYVLWLAALVLLPIFGLFVLGIYLQPVAGDLVRIGSYAEKDFGWNMPQKEFDKPLSDMSGYERYHDVVVLGDSFSTGAQRRHWQNYLVAATGWTLMTLDVNKIRLDQVLNAPQFIEAPPKLFIYETVERELPHRLQHEKVQPCSAPASLPRRISVPTAPFTLMGFPTGKILETTRVVERGTGWRSIKLGYVLSYLLNSAMRVIWGDAKTDAGKVMLNRPAPFSSVIKQEILVYKDDFQKIEWWRDMGLKEMACGVEQIRDRVEENGQTRFMLMVAPDKLTAYVDFLLEDRWRDLSMLAVLAGQLPDVMPRLDQTLRAAILRGEMDVYLPDDTHWGARGYQIAAETLLAHHRRHSEQGVRE